MTERCDGAAAMSSDVTHAMQLEYRLSECDHLALLNHLSHTTGQYRSLSRKLKIGWSLSLLLIGLAIILALVFDALKHNADPGYSVATLFLCLFLAPWCILPAIFVWRGAIMDRMARRSIDHRNQQVYDQMRKSGQINLNNTIRAVIDAHGLTEISTLVEDLAGTEKITEVESRGRWDIIGAIDVTDLHAFFEVGKAGWLILPRRVFPSDKEFLRFVTAAEMFRGGRTGKAALETGIMNQQS